MSYEIKNVKELKFLLAKTLLNMENENLESRVDEIITIFSYMNEECIIEYHRNEYVEMDFRELIKEFANKKV